MSKPKNKSKSPPSGPKTYTKQSTKKSSSALDEIDTLFASKKQSAITAKRQAEEQAHRDKLDRDRRKAAKLEEVEDELRLRGASSAATSSGASRKQGDAAAPQSLHSQAVKLSKLSYTRSDLQALNGTDGSSNGGSSNENKQKWASDGLGGIFNGEGYTGRKDEGGHRVFKAHLMNREGFGMSKDCPFDCDCCYI